MDWTQELQLALPAPTEEKVFPDLLDWSATERFMGRSVPDDYKWFLGQYGRGSWNAFILFFCPGQEDEKYCLPQEAISQDKVYREQKANRPDEYTMPVLPEDGSLMPFARTENGDFIGWIMGPEDPDTWPIGVLAHEESRVERFEMGFAEFMTRISKHEIKPAHFPEDIWEETSKFWPAIDG